MSINKKVFEHIEETQNFVIIQHNNALTEPTEYDELQLFETIREKGFKLIKKEIGLITKTKYYFERRK